MKEISTKFIQPNEKHKDEAEADPVRDSEDRMKQELANMEKKIDELKTLLQEKWWHP